MQSLLTSEEMQRLHAALQSATPSTARVLQLQGANLQQRSLLANLPSPSLGMPARKANAAAATAYADVLLNEARRRYDNAIAVANLVSLAVARFELGVSDSLSMRTADSLTTSEPQRLAAAPTR
jgi:hypothetical protein